LPIFNLLVDDMTVRVNTKESCCCHEFAEFERHWFLRSQPMTKGRTWSGSEDQTLSNLERVSAAEGAQNIAILNVAIGFAASKRKEASMSIDEIVHTCSNEDVARAAVASIGFSFVSRVKSAADLVGVSIGTFTARAVRSFADEAPASEKREVLRAMFRSDQPILRGLEAILERQLEDSSSLDGREWRPVTPTRRSQGDAARDCCYP